MLRLKRALLVLSVGCLVLYTYQVGMLQGNRLPSISISFRETVREIEKSKPTINDDSKDTKNDNRNSKVQSKNDSYLTSNMAYCTDLLNNGNRDAFGSYQPRPDKTEDKEVIEKLSNGCDVFKSGYMFLNNIQPNDEERDFPIAYSVVVHRQLHQLSLLLSAIYRSQNLYCIHVDAEADKTFKRGTDMLASCFPNVFISTKSEKVVYASFSRLQADVNCMRDLLNVPKTIYNWNYLINLCGQDFPLSTNLEIVRQLKELRGKNSIAGTREVNDIARDRTRFIHRLMNNTQTNTIEDVQTREKHDPPPHNMTLIKNLAYNVLSREFLQWALLDSKEGSALLNWSSFTHTPDEHFWGMLNAYPGAPGGSQNVSWWGVARAIIWKGTSMETECHGYWLRSVCVFSGRDISFLMQAPHMFANKIDVTYDVTAMTCLRNFLDQRAIGNSSAWNRTKKTLKPPESSFTS